MMDIYEFMRECQESGFTAAEAAQEWDRAIQEQRETFLEDYYNRPETLEGWAQQDLIDLYRFER